MAPSATLSFPVQSRPEITDLQAIRGVMDGHREMFEIIVRRYNPLLYRVGMAYLRNHAPTEDAMQNTYLKAFLKLERYEGAAAFSTWLTRIMINECLMLLRGQKRFPTEAVEVDLLEAEEKISPRLSLSADEAKEVRALLERNVAELPRSHRAVYLLREVQQLSTAETAACLGISAGNVKVLLHRAREGLKERLLQTSEGLELFNYSAAYCDPMTAKVMKLVEAI